MEKSATLNLRIKQKVDNFIRGRYNEHINRTKTWRCLYVYSTYTSQDR